MDLENILEPGWNLFVIHKKNHVLVLNFINNLNTRKKYLIFKYLQILVYSIITTNFQFPIFFF